MKVLYFGIYNPDYARNRVLIKGLKQNGVEVKECRDNSKGPLKSINLFFKYLRFIGTFDAVIVGFPGQEVMFLARFLTRKPIIFDAFTSHFGGYILDRRYYPPESFRAKYYRFLDKWSCKLADLVLLDTNTHIDFFVREFGLSKKKFRRVFVGTDSSVFYPRQQLRTSNHFQIHFHGNYIPLQGVQYIIQAAKLLEGENIQFNLIGRGQTFEEDRGLAEKLELKNINFIDSVPYEKLPDYIADADLCLGIFGDSPKTGLVIPNKVFEAMAMAKPIITADTPAVRELFTDRENIFLCRRADPRELADAILQLKQNNELRRSISNGAYKLFKSRASEGVIGAELARIISNL